MSEDERTIGVYDVKASFYNDGDLTAETIVSVEERSIQVFTGNHAQSRSMINGTVMLDVSDVCYCCASNEDNKASGVMSEVTPAGITVGRWAHCNTCKSELIKYVTHDGNEAVSVDVGYLDYAERAERESNQRALNNLCDAVDTLASHLESDSYDVIMRAVERYKDAGGQTQKDMVVLLRLAAAHSAIKEG